MRHVEGDLLTSRFGKRRRIAGKESKTVSLVITRSRPTRPNTLPATGATRRIGSKLSLQRGPNFREGMGNGLRLGITQSDGHKPKTRKGKGEVKQLTKTKGKTKT